MGRSNNLLNQRFGKLLVTSFIEVRGTNKYWECLCDCGTYKTIRGTSLTKGHTKSCQKCVTPVIDLTGYKFGRYTVLEFSNKLANNYFWKCICECGNEKIVGYAALKTGSTQSCGCLRNENNRKRLTTHGLSNTPEYSRFIASKRRAALLQRTPIWSDLSKIRDIYKNCPENYEVDHVLPLQGKFISGLHVPENLQYLTIEEHASKYNKFIPYIQEAKL